MEEDWENWCHRPGSLIHVFIPVLRREFSFLQEKLALQLILRHIKTLRQGAERGCPCSPRGVSRHAAG